MDYLAHSGHGILGVVVGTGMYWAIKGRSELELWHASTLIGGIKSKGWREFVGFLFVVIAGAIVAGILVDAQTVRQGFAAGMGWTALITNQKKEQSALAGK